VSNEDPRSFRQLRIDEILGLQREPAIEVWRTIEAGKDEACSAEDLGYPIEYFRTLASQEFVRRLEDGASYSEFSKLSPELETLCWKNIAALVSKDLPKNIQSPLCRQFLLKIIDHHDDGASLNQFAKKYDLTSKQVRNLLVLALAEEGLTLEEIGSRLRRSRERIRQILAELGFSTATLNKQRKLQGEIEKIVGREKLACGFQPTQDANGLKFLARWASASPNLKGFAHRRQRNLSSLPEKKSVHNNP